MADRPTGPPAPQPSPPPPGLHAGGAEYPAHPPERWPSYAPMGPVPPWGGPPPPPTPRPDGGSGSGRTWPAVVVAVVVVGALALALIGVGSLTSSGDDGDEATDATDTTVDLSDPEITAPPSEEPIMPSMPTIPGFDPGGGVDPAGRARPLGEVLPEIIDFVEQTRGHQFATDPVVEAVTDDVFEGLLAEQYAKEVEDLENAGVTGTALGLLPTGFDLPAASGELGAVAVLGFYDPETDELYVKGDLITPFVQVVMAHELTHALDDQIHGLDRLEELEDRPDESALGFLALVEGTASFVQDAFQEQLSPEDAEAVTAEQYSLGLDQLPAAMGTPPVLLVESQVPYASGQRFVDALVQGDGMAAVDAAYDDPPATSEQVLDPEVYAAGEDAVALAPLEAPAGVEVAEEGAFGAVDLRLLELVADPMSALLDPNVGLVDPVPGYGGGRFVSWSEGGDACVSLEAVGDDAAGSVAIQEALETWATAAPGAEVGSRVGGGGVDVITARRCG